MKAANWIAGVWVAVIGLTPVVALAADYRPAAAQGDIVIDGRLDEAAWQQAVPFSGFRYLSARNPKGAPSAQTSFRVLAGSNAIYIGIQCAEPLMAKIRSEPCQRDSMKIFARDCLEIFIDPSGRGVEYYQFVLSAANDLFDAYFIESGNTTGGHYGSVIQSAVGKTADGWTVEARIPLTAFYFTDAAAFSDTWLLNVTRERKPQNELSTWSPLVRAFHEPQHFNRIAGMPKKAPRFDLRIRTMAAVVLSATNRQFSGVVEIETVAGLAAAGRYHVDLKTGNRMAGASDVDIAAGRGRITVPAAVFSAEGKTEVLATLTAPDGAVVHAMRFPLEIHHEALRVDITEPFYANCIFPDQNVRQVIGSAEVRLPAADLDGAELEVSLAGGPAVRFPIRDRAAAFSIAAENLAVGDQPLVCRVVAGGMVRAERSLLIRKLAKPAKGSWVYVDRNLNLVVNGTPKFVRGWYGGSGYAMSAALRNRLGEGCDTPFVNEWMTQTDLEAERLDPSEKERISTDVMPSAKVFETMRKRIEGARENPRVTHYYLADEPECRSLSPVYLKHQYDFIKKLDPYHPVMIITRSPEFFTGCADILNPHPYLNPTVDADGRRRMSSPRKVYNVVRDVLESGKGQIAAWCTPQAFSYAGIVDVYAKHPTFPEFRCTIYAAIAAGAKGLTPFMYCAHFECPDLRLGANFVYETLAGLEPFLISPEHPLALTVQAPEDGVVAWAKTVDGVTLLIAVNLLDHPVKAMVQGERLRQDLFGYREAGQIKPKEGLIELDFAPYQVHLFTSRKMDAKLKSVADFQKELDAANAALRKPGNLLYGRGLEIEWDFSPAIFGGGKIYMLCDGVEDCFGYQARPGPAEVTMGFPWGPVMFRRARVYGMFADSIAIHAWKDAAWTKVGETGWLPGAPFVELALPESVSSVKVKFVFPKVQAGQKLELYEIELY